MFDGPVRTESKLADPSNDVYLFLLARGRDRSRAAVLAKNAIFLPPLSSSALAWGDLFLIYGKCLPIQKLESSRQPTVKIW